MPDYAYKGSKSNRVIGRRKKKLQRITVKDLEEVFDYLTENETLLTIEKVRIKAEALQLPLTKDSMSNMFHFAGSHFNDTSAASGIKKEDFLQLGSYVLDENNRL
uniref:Uncharacterized protein n=1 Tax=Polytomella parva TaxID=51329 RepID=A0A7S0V5C4_9CHLO|mmetsp:Transcript_30197/g.55173  ORF Transcript_30197/g.55173 Transcript_30197/m.55173 type:complete len:105 (+) Transcript_30197:95-409(+)|eukprot:CAMPEP_0175059728 /NCGR_PEP_ID=MMETSP0052_2-20121109/12594_1 /TAXON_ID=51329 ORGANISM="Polytomella parva, Strain SAG 63-3" /NCGR_SAMPLE_ID=MMETSP0052_2 /ASSEMBLY_ACC=CAM_ASM_000194 /LENGTH=104 /DNA_ID=CAMNT_0016325311 /DNA_START=73 /DNA_END=387 /DNA_ORIENTATION=-